MTAISKKCPSAVDVIYFDFAKAFDTVLHSRLLTKLQGYGIHGKAAEGLRQFLKDRRQRVVIKGTKSDWGKVTSGKCIGTNPLCPFHK